MSRPEWAYFASVSRDVKIAPHPILEKLVADFKASNPPRPKDESYSDHVIAVAARLSKEKRTVQIVSRPGRYLSLSSRPLTDIS